MSSSFSRSISLTPSGRALLGLTLLLFVAVLMNGHNLLYLLVSVLFAMWFVGAAGPWAAVRRVRVTMIVPVEWYAETPVLVEARLETPEWMKGWPLLVEWVGGEWKTGGGMGQSQVPRRGRFVVPAARISSSAPWGWVKVERVIRPRVVTPQGVERYEWKVFPRVTPMSAEEVEERVRAWAGSSSSPHEPTVELASVRAYRPGDDLRWVHWKVTAKRGRMMVKEFETLPDQAVVIQLPDLPGPGERREARISEVASVVAALLNQDRSVQLRIGGWATPFGTGRAHLLEVLHVLADLP